MPFAGYADFDDCVAKNSDKSDPKAYCATIMRAVEKITRTENGRPDKAWWDDCVSSVSKNPDVTDPDALCGWIWFHQRGESVRRHPDFEKIHKQFSAYDDGETRYYTWIKALNLDETTSYMNNATNRERFDWTQRHVDFQMWREDRDAKYWKVEAGFPLESMNMNVYTLEECQESARTLAHKTVNLNHKHILPTVEIPAAKFEDGVVEAVLRVPRTLKCPFCEKDKTINELIEEGKIVNVSLEAVCTLQSDDPHKCEGQEFTGLSLLTTQSLPGIPLTRLMPLENIMVEALQTSTPNQKIGEKRMKVKAIVKEQAETPPQECPEGEIWDSEAEKCIPKLQEVTLSKDASSRTPQPNPHDDMTIIDTALTAGEPNPVRTVTTTEPKTVTSIQGPTLRTVEVPPLGASPAPDSNTFMTSGVQMPVFQMPKENIKEQNEPTHPPTYDDKGVESDTSQPKPTQSPTEPSKTSAPKRDYTETPEGAPATLPHTKSLDKVAVGTSPWEALPSLEERAARVHAELKAKSAEDQTLAWELKHNEVYQKLTELNGRHKDLKEMYDKIATKNYDLQQLNFQLQRKYEEQCAKATDTEERFGKLNRTYEEIHRKYNDSLETNLNLSQKLTQANEDYLTIAQQKEQIDEKLKIARINAKKTLRLKI